MMSGAYPYMDLNAKYGKLLLRYCTAIDPNKDISKSEASAREIATCKQNVGQKEDLMHSHFQMDISLPWIDAAFT